MYEALLLDFYGTLVEEDTHVISRIVENVAASSPQAPAPTEVAARWAKSFVALCSEAHNTEFRLQRELELESLRQLLAEYGSPLDPHELSEALYSYWTNPQPLPGSVDFLEAVRVPICLVSNIDEGDIGAAIANLDWSFEFVVTSERARAYKPRAEPFEAGLALLGCSPKAVLHVGDSVGSDLRGAVNVGIDVAWVNPTGRSLPRDFASRPHFTVANVEELASILTDGYQRFN